MSQQAVIPYGAYWSTPFTRWQGAFAHLNSLEFAAHVVRAELARRHIDPRVFDHGVLGISVPQKHSFYGLPWLAGLAGIPGLAGPTLMQACATGVRTLLAGAQEIQAGLAGTVLVVNADRTSNGPHLYYPNPRGPGGTGTAEDWVMDNFGCDPLGPHSMLATAENVAKRHRIGTAEQHEVVLAREAQYRDALADGSAFLKRFMRLPFEVPAPGYKKVAATLEGDEGISRSTPEGLAALKPVMPGGSVTFGGQTHPADGNAGLVLTTPERARELASDPKIGARLAEAEQAMMPEAPAPAAARALAQAGLAIGDMDVIKTHNPFALNDLVFARTLGIAWEPINPFGCSLVWGHPQAPMGTRAIIELIEALARRGGGRGLFTGCAAGDSAMAVVVEVGDA